MSQQSLNKSRAHDGKARAWLKFAGKPYLIMEKVKGHLPTSSYESTGAHVVKERGRGFPLGKRLESKIEVSTVMHIIEASEQRETSPSSVLFIPFPYRMSLPSCRSQGLPIKWISGRFRAGKWECFVSRYTIHWGNSLPQGLVLAIGLNGFKGGISNVHVSGYYP